MAIQKAFIGNIKGPQGDPGTKGKPGETGATGQRGSGWTQGMAITGTDTEGTVFPESGISDAVVNDNYLNTITGNTYRCILGGDAETAEWVYTWNLKGLEGEPPDMSGYVKKTDYADAETAGIVKPDGKTTKVGDEGEIMVIGGDIDNQMPTFEEAEQRESIASGEKVSVIFGKIKKWFADLKTVAFTGSYSDLTNTPTIPAAVSVKGNAETAYRTGQVNLTSENIGAIPKSMLDSVPNYTFYDVEYADGAQAYNSADGIHCQKGGLGCRIISGMFTITKDWTGKNNFLAFTVPQEFAFNSGRQLWFYGVGTNTGKVYTFRFINRNVMFWGLTPTIGVETSFTIEVSY